MSGTTVYIKNKEYGYYVRYYSTVMYTSTMYHAGVANQ